MKSLVPVFILGALLLALVLAARCTQHTMHEYEMRSATNDANSAPNDLAERERMAEMFSDTLVTTTGVRFRVLREGSGGKPVAGNRVQTRYEGKLLDGTVFDRSEENGPPFQFTLMKGEVIRGWEIALLDMRKGEKRLVVIPSKLAYGERGRPPKIPPRATLVFEIELADFR